MEKQKQARKSSKPAPDSEKFEVTEFGRRRKRNIAATMILRVFSVLAVPFVYVYHQVHHTKAS